MAGNDEFDIDLTNFPFDEPGESLEDVLPADSAAEHLKDAPVLDAPSWDDDRRFEDLYSDEVLWKAWLLIKGNHVEVDESSQNSWIVMGSQPYVVRKVESEGLQVPWVTCTCPNGDARGGRPNCYHTAAVLSIILGIDLSGTPEPQRRKRG